jgi:hypothetical protein
MVEGVDQRATEHQVEEATEERRPVMAARDTEGERLDMAEDNIRHLLQEDMDNSRYIVRLLVQMRILVIRRCVLAASRRKYWARYFFVPSKKVIFYSLTNIFTLLHLSVYRMTPAAKRGQRKAWH